jgi:hypothetical protein
MTNTDELGRLVAKLPRRTLDNPALLAEAAERFQIDWPEDYVRLIADHNGVEGYIGDWRLVLSSVEDLPGFNDPDLMEFFPGLVMIGGDGGGESLALDRATREVLLVPLIGSEEDWLVLGTSLTEAFGRMERGEVFDAPYRSG